MYVGNLYDLAKGHKILIQAVNKIVKRRQDIIVVLIGSGKLRKDIENQISSYGLERYVKMVGGRSHDEIPVWINACDIFVLPSLNEGNPTVMFEALGCGKPFVGTKVGGVPEVIISDNYGLLVEPANADDLSEKILLAIDRKWMLRRLNIQRNIRGRMFLGRYYECMIKF